MEIVRNEYLNKFEYNNIFKMGGEEEQNRIELVEQTNNPEVSESVKVELSDVSTIIVSTDAIVQQSGQPKINESSLTDDQKKLANLMYDSTKSAIQSFMADNSLSNALKITKTIGQIIKQVESVKIDGKTPTSADKKAIVIQLGRILIKELISNDEDEILVLYDLMAEQTLEAMIDVSRVVNVVVQEMAAKCCPSLLDLFKRSKKATK